MQATGLSENGKVATRQAGLVREESVDRNRKSHSPSPFKDMLSRHQLSQNAANRPHIDRRNLYKQGWRESVLKLWVPKKVVSDNNAHSSRS
jgi:hypothetical protein